MAAALRRKLRRVSIELLSHEFNEIWSRDQTWSPLKLHRGAGRAANLAIYL
jgi:hypothetical protein